MHILITGATGLVGSVLRQEAVKKKHTIHFLTTQKNQLHAHKNAKGFYWNPSLGTIDSACFEGVDCIVHLAGATVSKPWTKAYKQQILSSRLQSTRLLREVLKEQSGNHQVKQIICTSAIGRYPPSHTERYSEDFSAESSASFMEEVVALWEEEISQFSELGIAVATFRIGLVLSAKAGILPTLAQPVRWGVGAAFGTGRQGQSWIHIDDLARLILTAAAQKWESTFNAVAPHPVSQKELLQTLAQVLKRPFWFPPLPPFIAKVLLGERSQLVLNSQWVCANKVLQKDFAFQYPKLKPALAHLLS